MVAVCPVQLSKEHNNLRKVGEPEVAGQAIYCPYIDLYLNINLESETLIPEFHRLPNIGISIGVPLTQS